MAGVTRAFRKLSEDWEFNTLSIYNYNRAGSFSGLFNFLESNLDKPGDILEAGVFRGSSLLAIALFLKEKGSSKTVYGFDSWTGFPPVLRDEDNLEMFHELNHQGLISDDHLESHKKLVEIRSFMNGQAQSPLTLSTSGDFSGCSRQQLEAKIDFLGLDNIVLIQGPFDQTMCLKDFLGIKLIAAVIDADLYASYEVALPFIWQQLEPYGYVHLDEYYSLKFPGARIATDRFCSDQGITPLMHKPRRPGDFERWYLRKA